MQSWSLSCGAAALATILAYRFGDPVSEADVIDGLLAHTSRARVEERRGFSLLDLKRYAEGRGYVANGYGDLTLADLSSFGPSIVRLHDNVLSHFVVFRGRQGDSVLLADPAAGTRVMNVVEFERLWNDRDALVLDRPNAPPAPDLLSATAADFESPPPASGQ